MDKRALAKCDIRIAAAEKALTDLRQGKSFADFDVAWFNFLSAWKAVYTSLEQGAKGNQKSVQWFGLKSKARRGDDLLQYLYQARNDDTHGLEEIARKVPGRYDFSVPINRDGSLRISNLVINSEGRVTSANVNGSNDLRPYTKIVEPKVLLLPVHDRDKTSGKLYLPPTNHLGKPLEDNSPLRVAELGMAYVKSLVEEARLLA